MKKALLTLLIPVLLAAFLLSGCKPSTAATPTPTPAPGSTETQESFIKAGETYRYYRWDFKTETQYLEETGVVGDHIRDTHEKLQSKYGITIKYVIAPGADWVTPLLESAYAGTPMADIANAGGPPFLIQFYLYNGVTDAVIENLSHLSDAATFSDPEYWDLSVQESFGTFNGSLYFASPAISGPDSISVNQVLYFNKRIVENAGISAAQMYQWNQDGEWTWDRYREVLVKTTDPDRGIYGTMLGQSGGFLYGLIASNNASFIGKRDVDGEMLDVLTAGEPNGVAAYEFFASIAADKLIDVTADTNNEVAAFSSGKYATMLTYVNRMEMGVKKMEEDYGILLPPKGPAASDYISDMNWIGPLAVMKNTNNPKGSAQLMEELFLPLYPKSSPENLAFMEVMMEAWVRDAESMAVLKSIPQYHKASNFMVYFNFIAKYLVNEPVAKMPSGETTPAVYFASVESAVNNIMLSYQQSN